MIERGRRTTSVGEPEPQARDLQIIRPLHRYRYLTTSQIARTWWPGRRLTRAQVRLRRMHEAGWVERLRPRLERGSHEWIYHLARKGFVLGQRYARGDERYIPHEAKWRPRDAVDLDYVWHDVELNEWMLAYTELLGDSLEDWLGPAEARTVIDTTYDSALRRHVSVTTQHVAGPGMRVEGLALGERVLPVFPDASVAIRPEGDGERVEILIEYDRTGRPAKNLDKFRRYDTLLTVGWRAVERLRRLKLKLDWNPPIAVLFVCQPRTIESLMRAADEAVTGVLAPWMAPEQAQHPGRDRALFCDAGAMLAGPSTALRLTAIGCHQARSDFRPLDPGRLARAT